MQEQMFSFSILLKSNILSSMIQFYKSLLCCKLLSCINYSLYVMCKFEDK